MILFTEAKPPELSPLIQIVIQINEPEPPKEYTLDEKIKLNINNCNTDTEWIRADTAECLPKPVYVPPKAKNPSQPIKNEPQTGITGLNGYVLNSCTGWVATHRYVPRGWGNATNWKNSAIKAGWTVSDTPIVNAIGWVYGHVVLVTAINNDGTVTISERNYDYKGSIRTKTVPVTKYTYLY